MKLSDIQSERDRRKQSEALIRARNRVSIAEGSLRTVQESVDYWTRELALARKDLERKES